MLYNLYATVLWRRKEAGCDCSVGRTNTRVLLDGWFCRNALIGQQGFESEVCVLQCRLSLFFVTTVNGFRVVNFVIGSGENKTQRD